jgi:hypothetical protein
VFESRWSPFFFAEICQPSGILVSSQLVLFLYLLFVSCFMTDVMLLMISVHCILWLFHMCVSKRATSVH